MTSPYGPSTAASYALSGDNTVDALVNWGVKWGGGGVGTSAVVTYSFPQLNSTWLDGYGDGEPFDGFQGFNAAQQTAARQALSLWSDVANVTFQEVPDTAGDVGDIRFGFSRVITTSPFVAWGYFPEAYPEAGDIWFDRNYAPNLQMAPGQFGFSTLLHEIGHAIGLDHPFDDGAGEPVLPASMDNSQYTIMAYDGHPTASVEAMSPLLLDILAIQHLYGANMTTRTGDDVYKFSTSEQLRAIWDAGGIDTIDASNQTLGAIINLNEGTFSSIGRRNAGGSAHDNIAIAYGVTIENAKGGSGSDKIFGNAVGNVLTGNAGNDTLDGGVGADTLQGGLGLDIYIVDNVGDVVDEQGNKDLGDEVRIATSVNLATFAGGMIERATALGNAAIDLTGNKAANILTGNAAVNIINGGAGADVMKGGAGNDVYFVDLATDQIDEGSNKDSSDEVVSTVTVNIATLGKGQIEVATLVGAAAINATGNALNNLITGNGAVNALNGAAGNDRLYGLDGNDTLTDTLGNNYLDGGNDNDKLTGGAGLDTLAGGAGNDTLTGGTGNDVLNGGDGIDVMTGGAGNDTYFVDDGNDKVTESGTTDLNDRVMASISVDLTKFAGGLVEHVNLIGTDALTAIGSSKNNVLAGNAGANILVGDLGNDVLDGGLGADKMLGGKGDDVYIVDDLGDVVDEQGNADKADQVTSFITVDLAILGAGAIEHGELFGVGAAAMSGNTLDNKLLGNGAANTLDGRDGNDSLIGQGGDDILIGGNGNDTLDGSGGNDTLIGGVGGDILRGGSGNDVYFLDESNDTISEGPNKDVADEIRSAFTINLASYDSGSIENALLLGAAEINAFGTSTSNKLIGNGADNLLDGAAGDDFLDGGLGDDTLLGGAGNDIYIVEAFSDVVSEQGNNDAGDEIRTDAFNIVLTAVDGGSIEHATLLGSAKLNLTGSGLSNRLIGNTSGNEIDGAGGDDTLDGGAGDDTLRGGSGNDVYRVDNAGDVVAEQGSDTGDELQTGAFSIDLTTFASGKIEHGTLLGNGSLDILGNAAANLLTGNAGMNTLNGGLGADTLRGGAGNDVYIIDFFDTIDEQGNADTGDEVRSDSNSLNLFTLGNGAIENATLLGSAHSANGNAGNNVLTGNSSNNLLYGAGGDDLLIGGGGNDDLDGGEGNDAIRGGSGNDTYYIDSLQDTIDEEGKTDSADLVRTSVDVDLSVLGNGAIENANTVTGVGTTISLKGNDSNNTLTGNTYANLIDGGKGDDTLEGRAGADTILGGDGNDTVIALSITDITVDGGAGNDTLKLTGGSNFDFTLVSQTAIQNIETIQLTGGGTKVIVSAQDVADLSSTSNSLFVRGDAGNSVTFTDEATYSGITNVGSVSYKTYDYGSSTVYLGVNVSVSASAASDVFLAKIDDSMGFRVHGVVPGSQFGSMSAGLGDVNQDGFEDALFVGGNAAFLLYGQAGAYDGPMSSKDPVGASIAELGVNSGVSTTVSGAGDFNGDGIADYAVGDWGVDFAATNSGGAYIVYGEASGPSDQVSLWTLGSSDVAKFSGASFGQGAGGYRGLAAAGDMNGDGYDDQLLSAYSSGQGIVYVGFGRSDQPSMISSATLNGNDGFAFTGTAPQLFVGRTIAGESDFNGDGYSDIVISSTTAATVIFGHAGAFDADLRTSELTGSNGFTITGGNFTVGPGGDFNGDGYDDIVVANKEATAGAFSGAGYVYVIFGKQSGFTTTLDVSQLNGANGFRLFGGVNENAGTSITLSGDYNGDGYDDLLIGAPGPFVDRGSAYVVYGHSGPSPEAVNLGALNGQTGMEIHGATSSSSAGDSVATADLNGDGLDEIIIGASDETNTATTGGAAYVLYGQNFTGNTIVGTGAGDTVNGGTWADAIAAGQGNDTINGGGGADAINTGQGNDEIHVADNKFFRIDGGTGVDTLHLDYDGTIDFANLDGNASTSDRNRIKNIEVIDVDNGHANALALHLADVLDLDVTISDVGGVASLDNVLRIDGNAGDTLQMFNVDGWGAADTSSLTGYAVYTYQAVKVAVDTDIAVSMT